MKRQLRLALVHLEVRYKDLETNRKNILRWNLEAALRGADVILNTEMPLAGYSFLSREDIAGYIEPDTGETVVELARIAREYGKYIGIGLAERDEATGIYYNSAVMIGPNGKPVCKHRKISSEMRWACPGRPTQKSTFETPWGRMGVLICSDTYYGLLPRSLALKGVDLLWVPANWPPGGLDPKELWKARVLENGFFLAACGRSGKDRIMDCREAVSCVYDAEGRELFSSSSSESAVFLVDLPLDDKGKLHGLSRRRKLKTRTPPHYSPIYLDLRLVDDLTGHYGLPEAGPLHVHCIVPGNNSATAESLEKRIKEQGGEAPGLFVFPPLSNDSIDGTRLHELARRCDVALSTALVHEATGRTYVLSTPDIHCEWDPATAEHRDSGFPFPMISYRSAKIGIAPFDSFFHPELAVAFAKLGCDLVVLSEDTLDSDRRLLCEVKTVENVAVAACASNGALVAMVPRGHERWEEQSVEGPGSCSYTVDIHRTRKKRFQDRLDFELLLRRAPNQRRS